MASIGSLIISMIMRTGNVEAGAKKVSNSLKGISDTAKGTQASLRSMLQFGGLVFGVHLLTRSLNQITEAHKQFREEGKKAWHDYMQTILDSIPIVGKMNKAVREMFFELSGRNAKLENIESLKKIVASFKEFEQELQFNISLFGTSKETEIAIKAMRKYEERLANIVTLTKEFQELQKKDNNFGGWGMAIAGLRQDAFKEYVNTIKEGAVTGAQGRIKEQTAFWSDLSTKIWETTWALAGYTDAEIQAKFAREQAMELFSGIPMLQHWALTQIEMLEKLIKKYQEFLKVKENKSLYASILDAAKPAFERMRDELLKAWDLWKQFGKSQEEWKRIDEYIRGRYDDNGKMSGGESIKVLPMGSAIPSSLASQTPILQKTANSSQQTADNTKKMADNSW